jgi:NAD(P)-dependent dehydrogenase (short-subunit alcohol dehydrogenase family)
MAKTIIVGGFGSGISKAVAEKFGGEGFKVALVARTAARVKAGAKELAAKGIEAAGFAADLGDPAAAKKLVGRVREKLGPIGIVQWTAYSGAAGDLLTAKPADVHAALDVAITGFLATLQAALPDLKKDPKSAVLVTNGGLGFSDPQVDATAVSWNAMGLALANAAKHKLVGLLAEKLKADRVFVGEVIVMAAVKGTAFDGGQATLEATTIAEKFWSLYSARREISAKVG